MKIAFASLVLATYAVSIKEAEKNNENFKPVGAISDTSIDNKKKVGQTQDSRTEILKPVGETQDTRTDKKKPVEETKDSTVVSKMFKRGNCPTNIQMKKDIELKRLEGEWFTVRSYMFSPFIETNCYHTLAKFDDATMSLLSEVEMRLGTHDHRIHGIETTLVGQDLSTQMFGNNHLSLIGQVLDTDYEKFAIDYYCFDNLQFQFDDKLEAAHMFMVGISTRDKNITDEEITKLEDETLLAITELKREDFTKHLSGDRGKCEYSLTLADL